MIEPARLAFGLAAASALVASAQQPAAEEGPPPLAVLKHGAQMYSPCLQFSPDGKTLASGGNDGVIRLWDTAEWRERAKMEAPVVRFKYAPYDRRRDSVSALAFSPDGKTLATGGEDGAITLWDPATGQRTGTLGAGPSHPPGSRFASRDFVGWLVFSPDGRTLNSSGSGHVFHAWDMATRERRDRTAPSDATFGLVLSDDGQRLAAADQVASKAAGTDKGKAVRVRDGASGRPSSKSRSAVFRPSRIVVSPDNQWVAWTSYDSAIRLLRIVDAANFKEVITLKDGRDRGWVSDMAFSKYAPVLASGGNAVRLWRVPTGEPLASLGGFKRGVGDVEFSPNGRLLAATGRDGLIRVWDVQAVLDAHGPAAPTSPAPAAPSPH